MSESKKEIVEGCKVKVKGISNSPEMLVMGVEDEDSKFPYAKCWWFTKNDEFASRTFYLSCLEVC